MSPAGGLLIFMKTKMARQLSACYAHYILFRLSLCQSEARGGFFGPFIFGPLHDRAPCSRSPGTQTKERNCFVTLLNRTLQLYFHQEILGLILIENFTVLVS